jgi:hypothetical protein
MPGGQVNWQQAIAAAERLMASHGFLHGPCLGAKELVGFPTTVWEIEFAHPGFVGRSPTTDPSSIELQIAFKDDDVQILDPWWNRPNA